MLHYKLATTARIQTHTPRMLPERNPIPAWQQKKLWEDIHTDMHMDIHVDIHVGTETEMQTRAQTRGYTDASQTLRHMHISIQTQPTTHKQTAILPNMASSCT